ncbi:MAG: ATP-binding protein [Pseudomonadota bacterium]
MDRTTAGRGMIWGVGLSLLLALTFAAAQITSAFYLAKGQGRAETTLRLTIQALQGYLGRYESIPQLLADDDGVRALVMRPDDPAQRMAVNRWLAQKNTLLQSSEIYVMTTDGMTIAASNHDRTDSFVGQSFAYRPYFTESLAGEVGRFFALGTTSGVRGYYFAAPIRAPGGGVAGVIAVKVGLDAIEAEWRTQDTRILVADPEGIVFLSTDPEWLYKGLLPLTSDRLARTTASRRYADAALSELPHAQTVDGDATVLTLAGGDGRRREYLVARQVMPRAGWTVHVLLDTADLRGQAQVALAAFVLLLGVALSMVLMIAQRRTQLADRIALQDATKAELERRVIERTADLARVNALIETEITERRLTEQELRRTQADLVQAGKLAALGQMSAALSHEINQPLAAARNYADSAAILIDRGDQTRARENVSQIVALIDRIAAIARHLRHVARKPDAPLKDVALGNAVAEAMDMVQPRLTAAGADVTIDLPADLPLVRAEPVRLQQVLVNILTNAADAVAGTGDRRIDVGAHGDGTTLHLTVRDHGPGVAPAIVDRIFDPFFTTKGVGAGLGLGLSISYNIMKDFGGDLRVTNHPAGGAVFSLVLQLADARRMAAE